MKTGGVYLGFHTFKREKVSVWELSDVRVLRSQTQIVGKTIVFSTVSGEHRVNLCSPEFIVFLQYHQMRLALAQIPDADGKPVRFVRRKIQLEQLVLSLDIAAVDLRTATTDVYPE